jgi:polyhydroxyalkanoate synthesis regulator phasin
MIELLKKATYIGVGFASMSKDKLEEFAKEISDNSDISEEEGRKMVKEFIEESKKAGSSVEDRLEGIMQKLFQKMDIPSRKEVDNLKKRIEELENSGAEKNN